MKILVAMVFLLGLSIDAFAETEPQKAPDVQFAPAPSKIENPSPLNMPVGPKAS